MSRSRRTASVLFALTISASSVRAGYAPGCTVALEIAGAHEVNAVAIQPDGKIVVAGYVDFGTTSDRDFFVARLHPDLTLDTSFNGTGYRANDLQTRDDEAFAVVVQFDQKIVVGGYSRDNGSKIYFAFARYNRDGSMDASFGAGGLRYIDIFPSNNDQLRGMAIQPDGKILGAGFSTPGGTQRLVVMRLLKNGNLDNSFDGNGVAQPTIGSSTFSLGTDVVVQPDGKIVVSGEAFFGSSDFIAVRLRPDGSLDTTFNAAGWVATDIGFSNDSASSVALQPDGKIVLAGTAGIGTAIVDAALTRYGPGGAIDATFDSDGKVVHDFGGFVGSDIGDALVLDAASNLLVAGSSNVAGSNFAFARIRPNGATDLTKTDDVSGMEDRGLGIAVTPAGKILVVGSGQGPTNPKTTLALYNPDGTQDCGSFFLHPTSVGAASFLPVGCPSNWDCVNDQTANAATGPPAPSDGFATLVRSAASPAEDLYGLADGQLPSGKVVTEIEVVAQLAWGNTGTAPTAALLYQRQSFDPVPVTGGPLAISNVAFQEVRRRFSSLNWFAPELDSLEIGLGHVGGNELLMTQNYVKVTYGETRVHPVDVFTAGSSGDSTSGRVMLNWLNPSYGLYDRTVIRRDTTTCPVTPADGVPAGPPFSDGLGNPGSFVDTTVSVGSTYFYTAFVLDSAGRASTGVCKSATPFDRTTGRVEWRYDTSIAALTTPGLRLNVPLNESVVYTVANDGLVHAIRGGSVASGGGSWPPGFKPLLIGGPAQARPPVIPLPPTPTLAVLLGSQDGRAYAVNALTGALIWKSAILGTNVQAAPAAALAAFGGGADLVFVATRNTVGPNRLYALDPTDGAVVWYFDNGGPATGIGEIVSGASVDNAGRRVFFTSALGTSLKTTWCLNYLVTPPAMCSGWPAFGVAPGGGDIQASPILYQGSVFVSETSAGDLYRVDPGSGLDSLVFNLADGGAKGFVFPQFGTTNLFASTSTSTWSVDYNLLSFNWNGSCVATPSTPTAVPFTDWVFVGSSEGKLFQFSASGGAGCPAPPSVCIGNCATTIVGAPAYDILKTMLYVGTAEGKIYGVWAPF